tara:strand:+ start:5189 stop:5557 length:369 start_codon:yes stop_codon:yes gene_type:complete
MSKREAALEKLAAKYSKSGKPKKFKMTENQKDITAGLVAGAVSTFATYPVDTITTRKQVKSLVNKPKQIKMPKTKMKKIQYHMKKLKDLYKGVTLKMSKNVPGTAITLASYATTKRYLDKKF